jgi:hypothetical protein
MIAYDNGDDSDCTREVIDSLGNIDFIADSDDWRTGTIYHLSQLDHYPYLRELAAEMGVK